MKRPPFYKILPKTSKSRDFVIHSPSDQNSEFRIRVYCPEVSHQRQTRLVVQAPSPPAGDNRAIARRCIPHRAPQVRHTKLALAWSGQKGAFSAENLDKPEEFQLNPKYLSLQAGECDQKLQDNLVRVTVDRRNFILLNLLLYGP